MEGQIWFVKEFQSYKYHLELEVQTKELHLGNDEMSFKFHAGYGTEKSNSHTSHVNFSCDNSDTVLILKNNIGGIISKLRETERQNFSRQASSGSSPQTALGDSYVILQPRKSKRSFTSPCPWTLLISMYKFKPNQNIHTLKEISRRNMEINDVMGIGAMNINVDKNGPFKGRLK